MKAMIPTAAFVVLFCLPALAEQQPGAAQVGDSASCTTLYHHGQRDIILCKAGDTYTKTEISASAAREVTISFDTYMRLMEEDTMQLREQMERESAASKKQIAELEAIEARIKREMAASDIRTKKKCVASGFAWNKGVCSLKETESK